MTNPTPPAPTPLPPDSVPEWRHITHDSEIFLEYRAPNGPWVQAGIFFPQPGFTVADFMAMVGQLRSAPSSPTAVAASNTEAAARWRDCAEFGWTVIANASGGNWDKESKDWQGAAALFRDQYHKGLDADRAALSTPPPLPAQADRGERARLAKHLNLPWAIESVRNPDAEYGEGEESHKGFDAVQILDCKGRVLFDSLNRDPAASSISEDVGEDRTYAWDADAKRDAGAIVERMNALLATSAGEPSAWYRLSEKVSRAVKKAGELQEHPDDTANGIIEDVRAFRTALATPTPSPGPTDSEMLDALEYDAKGNSVGYICVTRFYPPAGNNGSYHEFGPQGRKVRDILRDAIADRAAMQSSRESGEGEGKL